MNFFYIHRIFGEGLNFSCYYQYSVLSKTLASLFKMRSKPKIVYSHQHKVSTLTCLFFLVLYL